MVEFSSVEFAARKKTFNVEWKRVEPYIRRRKLTKDLELIQDYKRKLVNTYNDIALYLVQFYAGTDFDLRIKCVQFIRPVVEKLHKSFEILGFEYPWSDNYFELIDTKLIVETQVDVGDSTEANERDESNNSQYFEASVSTDADQNNTLTNSQSSNDSSDLNNSNESFNDLPFNDLSEDDFQLFVDQNSFNNNENLRVIDQQVDTMPQSTSDFLKLAATIINYKFEGDPLKLKAFLADVDLVYEATEAANRALCFTFIKRCLSGKALECITDEDDTIEKIKTALKDNIKPESSDVIEGRMMALRVRKGNFTEFTQEAEKLAEAFRRSLVVSGISRAKAQEFTIKKTIELCRKTARFETAKSVISSTKYEQPSEVLATLVTQNEIAKREKAESDAQKNKQGQNKNNTQYNKNGRRFGRGGGRGGQNQYNGNGSNQNFRQNGNRDNNQRGNYRGNGQNRGYQNRGGRPEHTIRFVSGNSPGPAHGQIFYPQQQMLQQPQQQQQQDQIFQIPY